MQRGDDNDTLDVAIVGAGLSGIAAAFHVRDKCPSLRYALLEGRPAIGGTWDLFRYPGIRSDSDMHTLGYSFRPWKEAKAIAGGDSILRYVKETARDLGIEPNIRLAHKVVGADWSSADASWRLAIVRTDTGEISTLRCRFLILCCGYFDYDEGYTPDYPGLASFRGKFVHPQKWTADIVYAGRRVVVIGSGATAVTLVPELAKQAKEVIMLQRSPTYISPVPSVDGIAELLKRCLPAKAAHALVRWKNILLTALFFRFCRAFPSVARRMLVGRALHSLRAGEERREDFTPRYDPWDQRLCFAPDGDFFEAINGGKARVITDVIETFTESGIRLASGRHLDADLVVSASGLKIKFLGGIKLRVDERPVHPTAVVPYKGGMLSGVPNLGMALGYTNASWTLKCDLTCEWLGRLLRYMHTHGYAVVTPESNPQVERAPLIDFSSGYLQRAKDSLPRQGKRAPWKLNQSYLADVFAFRARPLADRGLTFTRSTGDVRRPDR